MTGTFTQPVIFTPSALKVAVPVICGRASSVPGGEVMVAVKVIDALYSCGLARLDVTVVVVGAFVTVIGTVAVASFPTCASAQISVRVGPLESLTWISKLSD